MFLRTRTTRRIRTRLFSILLAGFALTWSPLPGLAQLCVAWDMYGAQRPCTFSETLGQCMAAATDSRDQCLLEADSLWGWARCHLAYGLDHTACIVGSPLAHAIGMFK